MLTAKDKMNVQLSPQPQIANITPLKGLCLTISDNGMQKELLVPNSDSKMATGFCLQLLTSTTPQ